MHNGGRPAPNKFYFGDCDSSELDCFLGIKPNDDSNDLSEHFMRLLGIIPAHLLPIGFDFWGNCICICTADGDDRGTIWFGDLESLDSTTDYSSLVYALSDIPGDVVAQVFFCIAQTFDEFLLSFREGAPKR